MYVHVFRADGRVQLESVNVNDGFSARLAAYKIVKQCNLQNKDKAAFCIVRPNYRTVLPSFSIRSYAVGVQGNALCLSEYDYLNPKTFPSSVAYMTAIGDAR